MCWRTPCRHMRPTPLSLPLHRGLNLSKVPIVASLKKACLLQWWQRHESRQAAWLLLGPWLLLPRIMVEGALNACSSESTALC